ncbi:hypothetical protein [Pseudomonas putida]|uniref:hypothetical protein n=1 Tax=Pseudomonas putida TaxID=303 RepID=UPI0038174941
MLLTIRFSYIADVIPPRCRNPRPVRFDDGVEVVTLREIEALAAPVAIISTKADGPVPVRIEYRWFEGQLWTSCSVFACQRQAQTSGGADFEYSSPGTELSLITDSATLSDHRLGIYVSSSVGQEAIGQYLQHWARGLIYIDGTLYRPAGEPRYVVMTFGLSNNHGGTSVLCTDYANSNIKEDAYFSLFQLAQAQQYAGRIAAARGDTKSFRSDPGLSFQVLIPKAIQIANRIDFQVAA